MVFRLTTDFPHEGGAFQGSALFCWLAGRAFLSGMAMPAGLFSEAGAEVWAGRSGGRLAGCGVFDTVGPAG
jgi:hypothetical protein